MGANDNAPPGSCLKAEINLPRDLPIQWIEVEVIAELLDSLPFAANDNDKDGGR